MKSTEMVHALYQLKPNWNWKLRINVDDSTAWQLDWINDQGEPQSAIGEGLDLRLVEPEVLLQFVI